MKEKTYRVWVRGKHWADSDLFEAKDRTDAIQKMLVRRCGEHSVLVADEKLGWCGVVVGKLKAINGKFVSNHDYAGDGLILIHAEEEKK